MQTAASAVPAKSPQPLGRAEGDAARQPDARAENPRWGPFALGAQTSMAVSAPDDPGEREADQVADRVLRGSDPGASAYQRMALGSSRGAGIQRKCNACGSGPAGVDEELQLQRQPGATPARTNYVAALIDAPGDGAPLSEEVRSRVEPALGADLSGVRVHTDARSQDAAAQLGAKAFAHRNDIYVAAGQSDGDVGLMAHEATHVVQQGFAGGDVVQRQPSGAGVIQRAGDEGVLGGIGSAIVSGGEALLGAARDPVGTAGAVVDAAGDAVSAGVGMARDAMAQVVEEYAPGAMAFFRDMGGFVKRRAAAAFDALFGGVPGKVRRNGLAGALEFIFVDLLGSVGRGVGAAIGASCATMGAVAQTVLAISRALGREAVDAVRQGAGEVSEFLSGLWDRFGTPAAEAISGFASDVWEGISETVSGWWDDLEPVRTTLGDAWNWLVRNYMAGMQLQQALLTAVMDLLLDKWEELKREIQPYMGYLPVIIGILLLFTPMAPLVVVAAVGYGLYELVSYLWESFGRSMADDVRQRLVDEVLPGVMRSVAELNDRIEAARAWLSGIAAGLAAAGMALLGALGALSWLASIAQLFTDLSQKFQELADTVSQKMDEVATQIRVLSDAFMEFIAPVLEFLRQTLLIGLLGPFAIIDDDVWKSVKAVADLAMTVPCIRELAGLMELPGIILAAEEFRAVLKAAWELIQNPQPILDALQGAIAPMIDAVPGLVSTLLSNVIYPDEPQHRAGVERHLQPAMQYLRENWWQELLNMGWMLIWPWPTVAEHVPAMLRKGGQAVASFFRLEISDSIDQFLGMMQDVNAILGALWGWFALAAMLVGGVLGGLGVVFSGGATVGAGIAAGWALAETVGLVLLGVMVATEFGVIGKSMFDIRFTNPRLPTPEEQSQANEHDYESIAGSTFSLSIVTALVVLGALAQKFASALWELAKAWVPGAEALGEGLSRFFNPRAAARAAAGEPANLVRVGNHEAFNALPPERLPGNLPPGHFWTRTPEGGWALMRDPGTPPVPFELRVFADANGNTNYVLRSGDRMIGSDAVTRTGGTYQSSTRLPEELSETGANNPYRAPNELYGKGHGVDFADTLEGPGVRNSATDPANFTPQTRWWNEGPRRIIVDQIRSNGGGYREMAIYVDPPPRTANGTPIPDRFVFVETTRTGQPLRAWEVTNRTVPGSTRTMGSAGMAPINLADVPPAMIRSPAPVAPPPGGMVPYSPGVIFGVLGADEHGAHDTDPARTSP